MVLTTRDGRRQVRIGQIGVGTVTVMTEHLLASIASSLDLI